MNSHSPGHKRLFAQRLAILCLLALNGASSAFPAKDTAIQGHVTDADKAAVAGVRVKAENEKTKLIVATETNADGNFALSHVRPGIYDITFVKDGFEFLLYPHIIVKKGEAVNLSIMVNRSAPSSPKSTR